MFSGKDVTRIALYSASGNTDECLKYSVSINVGVPDENH